MTSTDSEQNEIEIEVQHNVIGAYCDKCVNAKFNQCWCDGSDWDDEVIVIDPPNHPTPTPTRNLEIYINITKQKFDLNNTNNTNHPNKLTVYLIRNPPAGWTKFRQDFLREAAKAKETTDTNKRTNENGNGIIKGIRSNSLRGI